MFENGYFDASFASPFFTHFLLISTTSTPFLVEVLGAEVAQRMKRLRDEKPPEMHKRRRTEAMEVPSDLRDMEILLEDMGNVMTVVTEL